MSTPDQALAPIKARLEAATPGPWKADTDTRGDCVVWGPNGRFLMNAQAEPHWLEYPGEKRAVSFDVDRRDVEFIANAPTDITRLLAAIEAVQNLHAPRTDGSDEPYCRHCHQAPYGHAPYPCPTVAALSEALGGGE